MTVTLRMPCRAHTSPRSDARFTKRAGGGRADASILTGTSRTTVAGGRASTADHRMRNVLSSMRCARTPSVATAMGAIGGDGAGHATHNAAGIAARVIA